MGVVIELFNRNAFFEKNDFTAHEKTILGDIAVEYRDQGLKVRLFLTGCPRYPVARFVDIVSQKEYMLITKHRTERGYFEYGVTPIGTRYKTILNFPEVVSLCREHILDRATQPDMPSRKLG
ncbi:MAG: hypothetical protein DI586_00575 [Micavibrio aeruginosavorus]|uniref:Uncharacterized protein n=1 Tax=Micavibrio aeruginosavorus TaxID=349221 RepID=A0A2W5HUV4_9BACT|nr:MAG: hypothetical protein DI586_00575 [Micavibrio aeruginosavorus]